MGRFLRRLGFHQAGQTRRDMEAFPDQQASKALTILVDYIKNKMKPEGVAVYISLKLVTSAQ